MPIDLAARLKSAKLPERTVPVCLDGDLLTALADAEAALRDAGDNSTRTAALTAALTAAQDAVRAATDSWRLRGLSRPEWTSLMAAHPPREDNPADARLGWDNDTLPAGLVRACLIDPDVTDDAIWAQLQDVLTPAQIDELGGPAFELCRVQRDLLPFSSPASSGTAASAKKSAQPAS